MRSKRSLRWARLGLALVVLVSAACGSPRRSAEPDLHRIYDRAAQYHGVDRNPIIVIPGILGSRLVDEASERVVWGAFTGDFADPEEPSGARLVSLPLTPDGSLDARDDVRPDGALDRLDVSLLGLPISIDAYRNILATLGVGGYRDESLGLGGVDYGDDHFTCFQFDYDWRLDNAENAARLHEFIEEKRAYVQRELYERFGTRDADVRFDIVAHSMGGLVARYYLRYGNAPLPSQQDDQPITWAGASRVGKLILVATPNAGSLYSMQSLIEGEQLAPITPMYAPALLGTMPAIYELLPRGRHGAVIDADTGKPIPDLFDVAVWRRMQWGLADPRHDDVLAALLPNVPDPAERRRIADARLEASLGRARRFARSLDAPASPPPGVELHLFAGDAVETPDRAEASAGQSRLRMVSTGPGDGTVTRASALMDERTQENWAPHLQSPIEWSSVTFLFRDHLGLTEDPEFADNVLYLLLESPRAP